MSIEGESEEHRATRRMLQLLGLAGFASVLSLRLCDAMLPALAQAFQAPLAETSVVISSFAITYGVMQLLVGPLGDRFGKPRVICLATLWCLGATLAAAAAPTLHTLAIARGAMGAGAAAVVPLALAWIGDQVPMAERQAVLARFSTATLSGVMLGTWAGGFLTQHLGWRAAFLVSAALFVVAAVTLLRKLWRAPASHAVPSQPHLRQLRELLAKPWARRVYASAFFEGAAVFGTLSFVPSVLHERFALSLSHGGAVLMLFAAGGLLYSRSASLLLRRLHPESIAAGATVCMVVGYCLLTLMPHWGWAAVGCVLVGMGFFGFHNGLQVHATQLSTTSRGLAVSLFAGSLFMGQSLGVTLVSLAIAHWPAAWSFATAGVALALLGSWFAAQLRGRRLSALRLPAR